MISGVVRSGMIGVMWSVTLVWMAAYAVSRITHWGSGYPEEYLRCLFFLVAWRMLEVPTGKEEGVGC